MSKIIIILIVLGLLFFSLSKDNSLAVQFLDVGQGDAILISTPDNQRILIDGGPDNLLLARLAEELPWWETTIDYLIISHFHDDHFMGFVEVLEKYQVKHVLLGSHQPEHLLYDTFLSRLSEKGIEPNIVQAGDKFVASNDLYWQILLADDYHEDFNENSVVIKLSYKDIDFMLTGDLGAEGESRLLQTGFDLQSKYLKVGHHGSKYSSSEAFLQAVSPQVCIIQSGKDNKFGHPHRETIVKLREFGCDIRDNQDMGTISLFY